MSSIPELFAKNVEARLASKGWNRKKLATEAQVPPPSISNWLNGDRPPTIEGIESVAKALDTTPSALLAEPVPTAVPTREPSRADALRVSGPILVQVIEDLAAFDEGQLDVFFTSLESIKALNPGSAPGRKEVK